MVDSHEFLQALKFDALAHRIFVFSPQGDVYDLPAGATPIDFAYAVHTDVGDQTIGAKVNEKMAKLDYHLKSGDIVQIIRKKGTGPSRDWLNFVITTTARKQISRHFKGLR
jgi:GTP pyrophosphokinase